MWPNKSLAQASIVVLALSHSTSPCIGDENLPLAGTGVVSRITVPEAGVWVELSQGGRWLSVKKFDSPGGWGRLLGEAQKSVFVTNGLVIVLPAYVAFDLKTSGNPRNVIRDGTTPTNASWGTPVDGMAIGLKASADMFEPEGSVRLEVYIRNTGDTPLRVPACPFGGTILLRHLKVIGPAGEVISAMRGKIPASSIGSCFFDEESQWPILKPNQTLGPLHLTVITSDKSATIFDYWFDLSRPGDYQISLEYEGAGLTGGSVQNFSRAKMHEDLGMGDRGAALKFTTNVNEQADRRFEFAASPTPWQGPAWSGVVRVRSR